MSHHPQRRKRVGGRGRGEVVLLGRPADGVRGAEECRGPAGDHRVHRGLVEGQPRRSRDRRVRALAQDPLERPRRRQWAMRCVPRPAESSAGSLGAANGIAWRRASGEAAISWRRSGVVQPRVARPHHSQPTFRPPVRTRSPPARAGRVPRGDDHVDSRVRRCRLEQVPECFHLRDDPAAGLERGFEPEVDQGPSGPNAMGVATSVHQENQTGFSGSWKMWITAVVIEAMSRSPLRSSIWSG